VTISDLASHRVGALASILADVAGHLQIERSALASELFNR
jgi:hypothetical protein